MTAASETDDDENWSDDDGLLLSTNITFGNGSRDIPLQFIKYENCKSNQNDYIINSNNDGNNFLWNWREDTTSYDELRIIIYSYLRLIKKFNKLGMIIPIDIIDYTAKFYPKWINFKENSMKLRLKEKEIITTWFIKVFNLETKTVDFACKLLYDYNFDGKSGKDFHKKCDDEINTFSIIETEFNGHIFGCFADRTNDENTFLCIIRNGFEYKTIKPTLYTIKKYACTSRLAYSNDIGCGPYFGCGEVDIMNNSQNKCNHRYMSDFNNGLSGNVLCGGIEYDKIMSPCYFDIINMNTFTIHFVH